jgi:molybdopterin-containing oxidoreductase family iron-sulfur binding subunit
MSGEKISRRRFLGLGGAILAGTALLPSFGAALLPPAGGGQSVRYGMVVDWRRLTAEDIARMSRACHEGHNVPAVTEPGHEVKWLWGESFDRVFPEWDAPYAEDPRELSLPVLCNHCESPPCCRVCPTEATFKRADGVVMMDYHRCIGCRFCMAACPYGARSFNFTDPRRYLDEIRGNYPTRALGVVEKCDFCEERLRLGLEPLCAEASGGAVVFGDLADPDSAPRKLLAANFSLRRKAELGTGPNVHYLWRGVEADA